MNNPPESHHAKIRLRFSRLYGELRTIAERMLARRPAPSVGPHDLLHEVYVKLIREEERRREAERSRLASQATNFLKACVGRACKDILCDHRRKRERRRERQLTDRHACVTPARDSGHVHDVLGKLAATDFASAQAVALLRLKLTRGLSVAECAKTVGISKRTADRRFQHVRNLLKQHFAG